MSSLLLDSNQLYESALQKNIAAINTIINNTLNDKNPTYYIDYEINLPSELRPIVKASLIDHYAPRGYVIVEVDKYNYDSKHYFRLQFIFMPTIKMAKDVSNGVTLAEETAKKELAEVIARISQY